MSSDGQSNLDWVNEGNDNKIQSEIALGGEGAATTTPAAATETATTTPSPSDPAPKPTASVPSVGETGKSPWTPPQSSTALSSPAPTSSSTKIKRHPVHQFFLVIQFITLFSAFNMGLGQIIGMVYNVVDPIQYLLRAYVILLCLVAVLNELEWFSFTRNATLMNKWLGRGLFYNFIGVLGLEENQVTPARLTHKTNAALLGHVAAQQYIQVVAWLMIVCGMLYFAMGLCCLQMLQERLREEYQGKKLEAKQQTLKQNENWSQQQQLIGETV